MPIFKNALDTIFKKIVFISVIFIILTGLIFFFYIIPGINETLMFERKKTIHEMTDFMAETFHELEKQEDAGYLQKGQAKEIAIDMVNKYFYRNNDYFFAIDIENVKMIATPIEERLDSTIVDDVDAVGYPLGETVLQHAQDGTQRFFLPYSWKRIDSDEIAQKQSYFIRIDSWGWLLGTGMYVDDIEKEVSLLAQKIIMVFSSILIFMIGLLIYVIRMGASIEKQKNEIQLMHMTLIQNLPIGVFRLEITEDGKESSPVMWNKALTNLFEFPDKNYPIREGFHLQQFLVNQKKHEEIIKKARNGNLIGDEYEMRTFSRNPLWIRLFGYLTKKGSKTFFDASIEDVTGNHKADELLQNSYKELRKTDKMKSEIISITAHELRIPLINVNNVISSLTQEGTENFNEKQKSHLEKIINNTERLLSMINDMMDLEKLEKDEMKLNVTKINLNDILNDVYENFQSRFLLENKKCTITLSHPKPLINADKIQLKRVFTNLIDNALKFTKNEIGSVEIFTQAVPEGIEVHIKDNGIGIAKKDEPSIFEKFKQVEYHIERKVSGSGLGLPIVKKLIEKIGGKIEFKSEPNRGSDFYVTLPLIENDWHNKKS